MVDNEKIPISDEGANLESTECLDQPMELDLDDLEGVAGGKSSPQYRPFQGYGNKDVYDRMMQLENHTFRR